MYIVLVHSCNYCLCQDTWVHTVLISQLCQRDGKKTVFILSTFVDDTLAAKKLESQINFMSN